MQGVRSFFSFEIKFWIQKNDNCKNSTIKNKHKQV